MFSEKNKDNKYLIFWDNAGFHTFDKQLSERLILENIPAYSPQLNPAENLWKTYREYVSNRCFDSIVDMILELDKAYSYIEKHSEKIKSQTLYHWMIKCPIIT